jgi:serine/threonine protein kinase
MSNEDEDGTEELSTVDADAYLQIARDVERFEAAWSCGAPFPLEDLLRDRPEALHGELLRHALVVELAYRRDRGETPTVASYDGRFPLHGAVIAQAFAEAQPSPSAPPPAPAVAPRPFPAKLGKYSVLGRLGDGGQGSTFLARDPDLGHLVVLKRYHRGADAAALKEGQASRRVLSRHTAQCHGVERDGDALYLVMEYIAGRSLAEIVAATPPTPDAAARWIEQVAEGLAAVHACGLLHRDLKPSNIVVGDDGVPRLVDFGLAAHLGSAALQGVSGTAPYMAPEQARDEWMRIDFRTDVYGLGATLYHLLTGIPPHPGASATDSLAHARQGLVTPPRELNPAVPRRLEQIVLKALAANPAQRYATAAEFRQALRWSRLRSWRRAAVRLAGLIMTVCGLFVPVMMMLQMLDMNLSPAERPAEATLPIPMPPLTGELTVRIWSPAGGLGNKRGWKVDEPGALPVLPGEQVHLEAQLSQPAYAYLLWLNGQGEVASLYPWRNRSFGARPSTESASPVRHSPTELDRGWPMAGPPGLETALLLVRSTPLPPKIDLAALIGRLPASPLRDPREVAVRGFDPGQPVGALDRGMHRGLAAEAERIDEPLLQVMEKLRPHFDVIRAVRFAYRGE